MWASSRQNLCASTQKNLSFGFPTKGESSATESRYFSEMSLVASLDMIVSYK